MYPFLHFLPNHCNSRNFVHRAYQPPQVPDFETLSSVIERLLWDFRRVYIEQPRIRLDGVYIATCHYVYVFRILILGSH